MQSFSPIESPTRFSRYWQHFLFWKFENQESFSPILQTKNSLEILETFFKSENFIESYKKKSDSDTSVYTV